MDRARRWPADAVAVPAEAAPLLEELQDAHLHRRPDGGQLDPDQEGPQDVPVPSAYRGRGGGRGNGEFAGMSFFGVPILFQIQFKIVSQ